MFEDFLIGGSAGLIFWVSIYSYRYMRNTKQYNTFYSFMGVLAMMMFISVCAAIADTLSNSDTLLTMLFGVVIPIIGLISFVSFQKDVQTSEEDGDGTKGDEPSDEDDFLPDLGEESTGGDEGTEKEGEASDEAEEEKEGNNRKTTYKDLNTQEQLRELKHLYDEGLITEENYDLKQKKIMGI